MHSDRQYKHTHTHTHAVSRSLTHVAITATQPRKMEIFVQDEDVSTLDKKAAAPPT